MPVNKRTLPYIHHLFIFTIIITIIDVASLSNPSLGILHTYKKHGEML
jgi:hypothetical protein